ncbi:putative lysophospholipase [Leptospira weilii serovar Ranarum str. ICFT]|uniref:Lysophospholipase n=1 Tax=Leptospira weilii serovar Ranarum str. ICFT TaxID=1218598 RepID=N1WQY4_9LEPT|nr:alpha/beta hydrolase [Leptospira weilii]EMY78243.1 putative lysophospholipase [Leptospira weilii serovar Ranarum str. ICFT]
MIHFEHSPALKKSKTYSENNPPILFAHGAWHGAWCWEENFIPYFQKAGYDVYSMDMRGHGKSSNRGGNFRWHSIRNYVQDVQEVLTKLPRPPILIGHSMGGLVVQKILENTNVPGAVLLASVPTHGVFKITLELLLKHPIKFFKAILTLSLLPIVENPKIGRKLFFSKLLNEEKALHYASKMQDESFLAFLDMLILRLPKPNKVKTPLLVIGGEKDRFFAPWEVKRTANAYKAESQIFPGMGHNLMLDEGWEKVAEKIDTYLSASAASSEEPKKQKSVPKKKAKPKKKTKKK